MEKYTFTPEKQAMLESLPQPMAVYQFINNRIVTIALSDGFLELFGYTDRKQAYHDMNHDLFKYDHPDDVARLSAAAVKFAKEGGIFDVIYRSKSRNDANYRIIHGYGNHIITENNSRLAYIWYINEGYYKEDAETEEDAFRRSVNNALHEESILRASHYDPLTGLPSMTYFFQLAEVGKKKFMAEGGQAVLLYFDMNGMKFYNTRHSYAEGDKLLQSFGRLMLRTFGSENCCHIGADHFAAFTKEKDVEKLLSGLFAECEKLNNGNSLPVRVGVYSSRLEDVPVSTACDRAKYACDQLRNAYESSFAHFTIDMKNDAEWRQYILTHLDQAIEEKWIQVYYQPIVRTVTGNISDDEALARWVDPVKGVLSPIDFIPYLEDAGVIYKLDLYVVDQVLENIRRREEDGMYVVPQSVNLSRSDFDNCDIVEEIRKRVDAAGVPREKITIEITESIIGSDFDFMKEQVERFRQLGFPVWMDDFGSGYSSLDFLQSIKFDLLKFDMSFMKRLDEGENGKIILTELIRMASALGVDTACEGVETEEQVRFLREIGCSKLQGYYYARPTAFDALMEKYKNNTHIEYENPLESDYYETVGRVNLHDLGYIVNEDDNAFRNFFNTLPMAVIEINKGQVRFTRSNQSYRDFMYRSFGVMINDRPGDYHRKTEDELSSFMGALTGIIHSSEAKFIDESLPNGTTVRACLRCIAYNDVTDTHAVAVAVLSVSDTDQGTSYENIAKALAADYFSLYYVDLESEKFYEYASDGEDGEIATERISDDFFERSRSDALEFIYEEDRSVFYEAFTKENIITELNAHGTFALSDRLMMNGEPTYVHMKARRMQNDQNHIIIGVSNVDAQMKQKLMIENIRRNEIIFSRIMALSGDYLAMYIVDPVTDSYTEYSASGAYKTFGLAEGGMDFFERSHVSSEGIICPEDREMFLQVFKKENVMNELKNSGLFLLRYRLLIEGEAVPVTLRATRIREDREEKLLIGISKNGNS